MKGPRVRELNAGAVLSTVDTRFDLLRFSDITEVYPQAVVRMRQLQWQNRTESGTEVTSRRGSHGWNDALKSVGSRSLVRLLLDLVN